MKPSFAPSAATSPHSGKRRLSRRLVLSVLGASLLAALLVSAAQIYVRYRQDVSAARVRLHEIELSYLPNITASLWEANDSTTARLLDGIMALPMVSQVVLTDETGRSVARHSTQRGRMIESASFPLVLRESGQAFTLGTLRIDLSDATIMAELRQRAIGITVTFAMTLLFSSLFFALLFQRWVARHLEDMAAYVSDTEHGQDGLALQLRRAPSSPPDELDDVVNAINVMRASARLDMLKLTAYADELKAHRDTLEALVQQRTIALEQQNRLLADALRDNTALLAAIDQNMAYAAADADGNMVGVNARLAATLGFDQDQLIGRPYRSVQSDTHGPTFWHDLWGTVLSGKTWTGETCLRARDGSPRWFDSVISPFMDADGHITRVILLGSDITVRKAAEAELGRVHMLFSNVLDASSEVAIIATDALGLITIFNPGAERMSGYRADAMVGVRTPLLLHAADELAARGAELSAAAATPVAGFAVLATLPARRGAETRDWTYVRQDGTRLRATLVVTAVRSRSGSLEGYLFMARDITGQEQQHRQLLTMRDQLSTAASVANLGIWSWTVATDALEWNARNYDIFDLSSAITGAQLNYALWSARVHPDDLAASTRALVAAAKHGTPFDLVFRIIAGDGEIRHVQSAAHVERDGAGKALRVIGICRDISGQHELETRLRAAKEQAELASRAKSEFVANMSHEIRTPLNAVLGVAQLLAHSELTAAQHESVGMILASGKSLLGILNDILDFSKVEAGRMDLAALPFRLDDVIAPVAAIMVANAGNKAMDLVIGIDPAVPRMLTGDPLRIQQILVNLIGNAIKFTARGQVRLLIEVAERTADGVILALTISDTGIGMSTAQQQQLFAPFSQADTSITRQFGGTGLGLSICKKLIELMSGSITVSSAPDSGSVFQIRLPLALAEADAGAPTLHGEHLLVIDADTVRCDHVCRTLRAGGAEALGFASAAEATAHYRARSAQQPAYDAVLAAWNGDSEQDVPRLPSHGPATPSLPLVAMCRPALLAEFVRRHPHDGALALGQPILAAALATVLARARQAPQARASTPVAAKPLQGVHLLLVEDNPLNQFVAKGMLQMAGATFDLAVNGMEALACLRRAAPSYQLVLMDVQMPVMDGLTASRAMRAELGLTLPIVAMTAGVMAQERQLCRQAGMNAFLAKPIDYQQMLNVIAVQLERQHDDT
jgi:PAS domain S-box-containing protein